METRHSVNQQLYSRAKLRKSRSLDVNEEVTTTTTTKNNPYDLSKLRKTSVSTRNLSSFKESGRRSLAGVQLKTTGRRDESNDGSEASWLKGVLIHVEETKHAELIAQAEALRRQVTRQPAMRRVSVSDNDIVTALTKAASNDSSVTTIHVKEDGRFQNLKPAFVVDFAEELGRNLNLTSLTLSGVGLGNEFLSTLADSMTNNFILRQLDLSGNAFTNDGLVDLCVAMEENQGLVKLDLSSQNSAIFSHRQNIAMDALRQNMFLQEIRVEFQDETCTAELRAIEARNQGNTKTVDHAMCLVNFLTQEIELSNQLQAIAKAEVKAEAIGEEDMPYLYELHQRADKFKIPIENVEEEKTAPEAFKQKASLASIVANQLLGDGSFINNEFIDSFLSEESQGLVFDFTNQIKLFKRFSPTDPKRQVIVEKFVSTLLNHPKSSNITHLVMANALLGDDFVTELCRRCQENPEFLSDLHMINFETNFVSSKGFLALTKCIADPKLWCYLQVVRLDNQKYLISSEAEDELARALCVNQSVIKLSFRVRNLQERRRVNSYITRNIDFLRQARRWYGRKHGLIKARARNRIEQLFDQVHEDDPALESVELVADQLFLSLHPSEKLRAAESFGRNFYVHTVKLCNLQLDDAFAKLLGKAMETNESIETLNIESNCVGSDGVRAITASLSVNRTLRKLFLRHQSKKTASGVEEEIPSFLEDNHVLLKLGLDVRSSRAQYSLDQILRRNNKIHRDQTAK